ncbi:hypothetical protein WJX73_010810 [Symbiochloris irregularis]|uniref:Uncharacterized protein n=1 Tax=Symbiochloris irregularis TaxID=706552 RepID=A0AAW1NMY5_9CHLO
MSLVDRLQESTEEVQQEIREAKARVSAASGATEQYWIEEVKMLRNKERMLLEVWTARAKPAGSQASGRNLDTVVGELQTVAQALHQVTDAQPEQARKRVKLSKTPSGATLDQASEILRGAGLVVVPHSVISEDTIMKVAAAWQVPDFAWGDREEKHVMDDAAMHIQTDFVFIASYKRGYDLPNWVKPGGVIKHEDQFITIMPHILALLELKHHSDVRKLGACMGQGLLEYLGADNVLKLRQNLQMDVPVLVTDLQAALLVAEGQCGVVAIKVLTGKPSLDAAYFAYILQKQLDTYTDSLKNPDKYNGKGLCILACPWRQFIFLSN